MLHTQLTQQVRHLVRAALSDLGLPADEELHETILITHGHYSGRRFEAECGHAVWFLEEGQIKVFDTSGKLHQTLRLPASESAKRAA